MRTCLRCEKEMVEDLNVQVDGGFKITEQKNQSIGNVKCAVCPECGYMEPYIVDMNEEFIHSHNENNE